MLLTISTTYQPATDLGYLLHKNPARCQTADMSFGLVHIFYPVAAEDKCTAAVLLDVDPVEMVRGQRKHQSNMQLEQYINDRPYVASSFLSVAIARLFGSALKGECKERPELARTKIPLNVKIAVLPSRGGEVILHRLFEPLGYEVSADRHDLDAKFPDWGQSPYYTVELKKETLLSELLTHLYVLVPVLDNHKHYFIGKEEVEKLLIKGKGWLKDHPDRDLIARRYLKYRTSLASEALARLTEENPPADVSPPSGEVEFEQKIEKEVNLNEERLGSVLAVLRSAACRSIIDLGCGEGKLLRLLLKEKQFEKITGMDVSVRTLEIAAKRLRLDDMAPKQKERINLIHGSLMYRDRRFEGYDAAAAVEVIEHLDLPRLKAFERVVFEFAKPRIIVITTPNREFNVTWETLPAGKFRHPDHRFEWTRKEFDTWCNDMAGKFGYQVRFLPIGTEKDTIGSPTQMAVFSK
jgi:3' terminal RNA ribose 2'-O-methyltransferase Hen1